MAPLLKLNFDLMKELDAPNLIIDIWSYSDHLKKNSNCLIYEHYRFHCLELLKKKWQNEWGDFDHIMNKIKKNDKNFINIGKYSSADRHSIIDFLKKIEENKKKLLY